MSIQKIKKNVIIDWSWKVAKDAFLKLYADCNILNQKIDKTWKNFLNKWV